MNILHLAVREGGVAALLCQAMIAMMSAMLSYFFNFLMEDHPVGRWYLSQLQRLPEVMAKPLGECPYCSAPWQYLAINFLFISDTDWFICFLGLGLNFATIRFLIPPVK